MNWLADKFINITLDSTIDYELKELVKLFKDDTSSLPNGSPLKKEDKE